ncbi:MAG: haloperoxidase [Thalassobius sp.]|nr:haloperoxidase [Thalassovita sp.]
MKKHIILIISICIYLSGCSSKKDMVIQVPSNEIDKLLEHVTDVMVHDVTNPPLAARFFSYICLSGYEVLSLNSDTYPSMQGSLNTFPTITQPQVEGYSVELSALLAMMATAKKVQPSGNLIADYEKNFLDSCKRVGYSIEKINKSIEYAHEVSKQILAYAKEDGYNKTSNFPKYTPLEGEGYWYPTPPAFFAAVEPYFNTVRPFTLDSAAQFKPEPPVAFNPEKDSPFYKLMMEVYEEGSINLGDKSRAIATFWDCNPFAVKTTGHLMVALKKISPGAHWIGITGIACRKENKSFKETLKIHTVVSVGLMDAFLSCWDEKYRSDRIRPETAIRKYIDPNWEPLLQTPPFPEYTSGHSTISAASAYILTHYFGDNFSFTDSTEIKYSLPTRNYTSFMAAAKEAAVSRLYGGIHYRDANENGTKQGLKVGEWVISTVEKIETKPLVIDSDHTEEFTSSDVN